MFIQIGSHTWVSLSFVPPAEVRIPRRTVARAHFLVITDSFPVPTYLFFKGNERLGRNDVKVAGQAGKGERKEADCLSCYSLKRYFLVLEAL